jgi:hypothetical protein
MSFATTIKRIDPRNWDEIKAKWLSYSPTIYSPGEPPQDEIFSFVGLPDLLLKAKKNPEHHEEVSGLRQEILREGFYFLHKSVHVCGCAISHLNNGILSWSISSAYQSSFFSLKGILCLLGLSFPRINNETLLIDSFPKGQELTKSQIKKGITPLKEMKFIAFQKALGHEPLWEIFQRVLRVLNIAILDEQVVNFLKNLNPKDFTKQRNSIHYKNSYWLIPEDLFHRIYNDDFGAKVDLINKLDQDIVDCDDLSVYISYLMLYIGLTLLKDLSEISNIAAEEFKLIQTTISEGIHNRYLISVVT